MEPQQSESQIHRSLAVQSVNNRSILSTLTLCRTQWSVGEAVSRHFRRVLRWSFCDSSTAEAPLRLLAVLRSSTTNDYHGLTRISPCGYGQAFQSKPRVKLHPSVAVQLQRIAKPYSQSAVRSQFHEYAVGPRTRGTDFGTWCRIRRQNTSPSIRCVES